jgi:hypothetical protein
VCSTQKRKNTGSPRAFFAKLDIIPLVLITLEAIETICHAWGVVDRALVSREALNRITKYIPQLPVPLILRESTRGRRARRP